MLWKGFCCRTWFKCTDVTWEEDEVFRNPSTYYHLFICQCGLCSATKTLSLLKASHSLRENRAQELAVLTEHGLLLFACFCQLTLGKALAYLLLLDSCGGCNKTPQSGWLQTGEAYCFPVLDARSPKSICLKVSVSPALSDGSRGESFRAPFSF